MQLCCKSTSIDQESCRLEWRRKGGEQQWEERSLGCVNTVPSYSHSNCCCCCVGGGSCCCVEAAQVTLSFWVTVSLSSYIIFTLTAYLTSFPSVLATFQGQRLWMSGRPEYVCQPQVGNFLEILGPSLGRVDGRDLMPQPAFWSCRFLQGN